LKRAFKSSCAAIRSDRQGVRIGIREEILEQRALRIEVEKEFSALRAELEDARKKLTVAYIDSLFEPYSDDAPISKPSWKSQYEKEYWDWVDEVEERFDDDLMGDDCPTPEVDNVLIGDYYDDGQ